jgi:hypothetical protein
MVPPALLPIRKEGVPRIFIALKNPSPWPGSNPQSLGPVASTLTTTPPRQLGRALKDVGLGRFVAGTAGGHRCLSLAFMCCVVLCR